jgi:hypothetical protein
MRCNTLDSPGFEAAGWSDLYETIEATTRFFLKSYEEAERAKDGGLVTRALHPGCKRQVMPASFIRENPKRGDGSTDNATYRKEVQREVEILDDLKVDILYVCVDTRRLMSTAHAAFRCHLESYGWVLMEQVWTFHFTEDGTKIVKLDEFVDSFESIEMGKKLRKHLASLQA